MAYLKRNKVPKFWAVPRKGTKYVATASHNKKDSIPLLIVVRDIFKIVRNKKELKKVLNEKQIAINNKEVRETNYPICLFDVVTLIGVGKSYRANLSKQKKIVFDEVSGKYAETKVFKVIGKKILKGKKMQLNLMDGKNILAKEKVESGDSVVLNLKDNKIERVIPMKKGEQVFVIRGRHGGWKGKIDEVMERGGKEIAKIISDDEKINVETKNVVVIE